MNLFVYFYFLLGIKVSKSSTFSDISNESLFPFKVVSMFFNESYLNKLKIRGTDIEGASVVDVTSFIVDLIESKKEDKFIIGSDLRKFATNLGTGLKVLKKIRSVPAELSLMEICPYASDIQRFLLEEEELFSEVGSTVIIPFRWNGIAPHAICIQLQRLENHKFRLTILNSGDGVNYHFTLPSQFFPENDWRRIYPYLFKLWIDFENVPENELFDETAWFFSGLIYMQSNEYMQNVIKESASANGSVADYFYGSFLVNLVEYLKPALSDDVLEQFAFIKMDYRHGFTDSTLWKESIEDLVPPQRSGTCSISSLLVAIQYASTDLKSYYRNKLILGHLIMEDFVLTHLHSEFLHDLLSDGSEAVARNLFKKISFSMTLHLAQYLEESIPELRHVILLNSHRYGDENVANLYLERVSLDTETLEFIDITVHYCKLLREFLKEVGFNPKFTSLIKNDILMSTDLVTFSGLNFPTFDAHLHLPDVFQELRFVRQERLFIPVMSLGLLATLFGNLDTVNLSAYNQISDAIDALPSDLSSIEMWSIIDASTCMTLLTGSIEVLKRFLVKEIDEGTTLKSMEHVLLIGRLLLLSWYAAVQYDNYQQEPYQLHLHQFSPPIRSFLKSFNGNDTDFMFTPGVIARDCGIINTFEASTISKIRQLWDHSDDDRVEFLSIVDLISTSFKKTIDKGHFYSHVTVNPLRKSVFDKVIFFNKDSIQKLIKSKRTKSPYSYVDPKIWIETSDSILEIILAFTERFTHHSHSHFYYVMDAMFLSHYALTNQTGEFGLGYLFKIDHLIRISLNYDYGHLYEIEDVFRNIQSLSIGFGSKVFNCHRKSSIFFLRGLSLVGFEYWLNYIKGAVDSTIFLENPEFCKISDTVLNMPKVRVVSNWDSDENLGDLFFVGFKRTHADDVIHELMRLIYLNSKYINQNDSVCDGRIRKSTIESSVNIGIILTKFISRCSWHNIITLSEAAIQLSTLYNELYVLSKFDSGLNLDDQLISTINLVLALICNVKHLDESLFLERAIPSKKAKEHGVINIFTRTMARYHWLMVKANFKKSNTKTRTLVDSIYNNGFIYHEISFKEIEFQSFILQTDFLSKIEVTSNFENIQEVKFEYSSGNYNLNIVKISFNNRDEDRFQVILQFTTGMIYFNNIESLSMSKLTNDEFFRSFFNSQSALLEAEKGNLLKIAGCSVFYLPNYMIVDNDIVILMTYFKSVFRKINGHWFVWDPHPQVFLEIIQFSWIEDRRMYHRKIGSQAREVVLIGDFENEPYISAVVEGSFIDITIGSFEKKENEKWVITRKNMEFELLNMTFYYFGYGDYIRALSVESLESEEIGLLTMIYPGLRLQSCMKYPLVLKETISNIPGQPMQMKILNSPDLTVISDQTINGGVHIPYTLIVENMDSKKFILVPRKELRDRRVELDLKDREIPKTITQLEMIPIFEGKLAPQTRLQKLLLAYYNILAYEYDTARRLLHRIKSVNLNEPFSFKELEIIEWIICINGGGPEAESLKLLTYAQFELARMKFPMNSEDFGKVIQLLKQVSRQSILNYMYSIRDVPEKFYIHVMIPEILGEALFARIFVLQSPSQVIAVSNENFEFLMLDNIGNRNFTDDFKFEFEVMKDEHLGNFTHASDHLTKMMSKLCFKRKGISSLINESELILFGLLENRKKWNKFGIEYNDKMKGNYRQRELYYHEVKDKYLSLVVPLSKKCGKYFGGIDQSIDIKVENRVFHEVMQSDTTQGDESNDIINYDFEVATTEQINEFAMLRKLLSSKIQKGESETIEMNPWTFTSLFGQSTVQSFEIVKRIENSIEQFSIENNSKVVGDIDLSPVQSKLEDFIEFSEVQKKKVDGEMTRILAELELIRFYQSSKLSQDFETILNFVHEKKEKGFDDLYACYQKNSISCVQRKFRGLNREQCKISLRLAAEMYSFKVLLELVQSVQKTAYSLINCSDLVTVEDVELFCSELKKIEDLNSRLQDPTILNFEFRSVKYLLRSEQVRDIEMLSKINSDTGNFSSIVIQRMMAAGKTLILGTISVMKKAMNNPEMLSILVPPASLYQSNTIFMQERTYNYFKKQGRTFSFPRFELPNNPTDFEKIGNYLTFILDTFKVTMEERSYLILSPNCLQSFHNSYIEMLNYTIYADCDGDMDVLLKYYAKIYQIFRKRSSIILDEIDMTMDPHKELNFPTREYENLNMIAGALIADLIEFATFDKGVKSSCKLNIHGNEQYTLTDSGFDCVKEHWLNYINDELINGRESKSIWGILLLRGENENVRLRGEDIFEFVRRPITAGEDTTWIRQVEANFDKTIAHSLIIVRSQIHDRIRGSFNGAVNQTYGFGGEVRPGILHAVPYIAANTPSENSVFADRWETLTKTLFMYAAVPCQREIAIKMIPYIRSAILKNIGPGIEMHDTVMGKICSNLFSANVNFVNLDHKNHDHINIIHEALKDRSPLALRLLFSFALDEIFNEIEFPTEQVTSNSLNMASMFSSIQGYTGTIDNVNTLPHEVVEYAYQDNLANEKNNGGIAKKLINDGQNAIVPQLKSEAFGLITCESFIREILKLFGFLNLDDISAIIDTGAFFKSFRNVAVAEGILKVFAPKIECVIYYNEQTNQLEFISKDGRKGFLSSSDPESISKATGTDINQRFTFYDQRHITGSDILQPKKACALMTVGARIRIRDVFQGTLRMRQFMSSQKVYIVTTESTLNFYKSYIPGEGQDLRVSDILALGCINEEEAQKVDNIQLAYMKIDNEIRRFILDQISDSLDDSTDSSIAIKWFQKFSDKFIRTIRENPMLWLQLPEYREASETLKGYLESNTKRLMDAAADIYDEDSRTPHERGITNLDEKIKTEILGDSNSTRNVTFHRLLHGRFLKDIGSGLYFEGQEVEYHLQAIALQELNLELYIEQSSTRFESVYRVELKLDHFCVPETFENDALIISLSHIAGSSNIPSNERYKFSDIFITSGQRVFLSSDLLRIASKSDKPAVLAFTNHTWEGSHFLVQVLPQTNTSEKALIRVTLLSKHFSEIIHKNIKEDQSASAYDWIFWLCDLSGNITATTHYQINSGNILDIFPIAANLIFDGLLFNGSLGIISMSKRLRDIYENVWLNNENFKNRALFFLLRMKLLNDKAQKTISVTSEIYRKLERAALGDSSIFFDTFCTVGSYAKPITDEFLALQDGKRYEFKQMNVSKINMIDIFQEIFGNITLTYPSSPPIEPEYNPKEYVTDRTFVRTSKRSKLNLFFDEDDILDVPQIKKVYK